MYKRTILTILSALVLINGRALFLLLMDFLSMGGIWVLSGMLILILIKRGAKAALKSVLLYLSFCMILWLTNVQTAPYEEKQAYSVQELVSLTERLIEITNKEYTNAFHKDDILVSAPGIMKKENAVIRYDGKYALLNRLNLSGIFLPFTGTAFINSNEQTFLLPFVSAHEIAHRKGFLSEGQANMHAYLMCMSSEDASFRYSASVYALKYALHVLENKNKAEYTRLTLKIENCVKADLSRMNVCQKKRNRLSDYSALVPCLIHLQSITSQGVT